MSKKKTQRKKAQQVASRLRSVGQFDTAQRLVEAFSLDKEFFVGRPQFTADEAMADIDDAEVMQRLPDLKRYIPTEASMPEADDLQAEEDLIFEVAEK